jgi:hypothetical protein
LTDKDSRSPRGTAATRCAASRPARTSKLTYVRGPSGIIVMLAQELNKT